MNYNEEKKGRAKDAPAPSPKFAQKKAGTCKNVTGWKNSLRKMIC